MIHAVGVSNRFQSASRLNSYARIVTGFLRYPLSINNADQYLLRLDHPQALKTSDQVETCFDNVLALGLPAHKGKEKNWDFLVAFSLILDRKQPQDCVLSVEYHRTG